MPASIRRHAVVLLLILAAAAAGVATVGRDRPTPVLPAISDLTRGSAWSLEAAYAPGDAGGPYRQWLLRAADGTEALLYVGATSRPQTMVRWTGELGYQGEGYLVVGRSERTIRLTDGSTATASGVFVERQGDRRLLEYAVVRPDGVVPTGTSSPAQTAWSALANRAGPYYMVRVAVPAGRADAADLLLAAVLPPLSATSTRAASTSG
ncbi:MAG TPA: hypothetical protein VOB72_06720 [Candidatus Dormibacteraeota bacterium]|nr:hypothetical protein [Candidatus Dormibacteraeota bacterium]